MSVKLIVFFTEIVVQVLYEYCGLGNINFSSHIIMTDKCLVETFQILLIETISAFEQTNWIDWVWLDVLFRLPVRFQLTFDLFLLQFFF